jgi:glycerophosphoryl diester phosphodiesterase
VVGHRGWPSRFPDSTLAGLIAASSVADMVEVDVRRSGDGKLVLSHDPSLAGHAVAERPWAFLADVDLGDGHRPALLDEALVALPGTPVMIEVKNEPFYPGFEPDHRLALEAADRSRPGDLLTSFNWASVDRVRREYPEVSTGLIVATPEALAEAVRRCLDVGHTALVPQDRLVDGGIAAVLGEGLTVHAWTVDDPERARELAGLGVSGIITDHPDRIREAL